MHLNSSFRTGLSAFTNHFPLATIDKALPRTTDKQQRIFLRFRSEPQAQSAHNFLTAGCRRLPWVLRLAWTHMGATDPTATPSGHTPEGGVLVGNAGAIHQMLLFEDPQCPYCREFEERNGPVVATAVSAGFLAVEYRMRCFLGPESVRADNALALAGEVGRFDELRQALFAAQPPEGTGGFTVEVLLELGAQVGLTGPEFVAGVREGRYEQWILGREAAYQDEDPQGTPAAWLDNKPLDARVLFDGPALESRLRA
jgi:Thioredoxin